MDMRNNVFYNWAGNGCYGGEGMCVNIVNNYYKPGPATPKNSPVRYRIAAIGVRIKKYCMNADGTPNAWKPMEHVWGKFYVDGNIIGDIITYFVFTLAGAEMWQRAFAAKSQKAAKEGLFLGTFVYGLTIPLVWFMGVVAHQLVSADKIAQYGSTDAVVPALAIEILPVGLTGLALAGILSVIMSTADSYLIVSVQTCVHDIYKVFKPDIPEKKELRLTRVFAFILPLGALVIALYIKNAYNILMFAWSFYAAAAGLPAFAALYWKKATKAGIISGMAAGFVVCVGWKLIGTPFGLGPTVPGAIACAAALVIVSLATYKKTPSTFLDPYHSEKAGA